MSKSVVPNLKAPRFRSEHKIVLDSSTCKEIKKKVFAAKDLSENEIKTIVLTFNELLYKTAIENRDGVQLPDRLGHIFIGTCPKKKSVNIDYKKSADYNQVVQHRNWESDGYLAKIFYTSYPKKYNFRHKELWKFVATRNFTREVGKTYPENWKMYVEVDPKRNINRTFSKNVERIEEQESDAVKLQTYNEFEI